MEGEREPTQEESVGITLGKTPPYTDSEALGMNTVHGPRKKKRTGEQSQAARRGSNETN